jgi:hypothetical protein
MKQNTRLSEADYLILCAISLPLAISLLHIYICLSTEKTVKGQQIVTAPPGM